MRYRLKNFPITIEPCAEVISGQIAAPRITCWTHFFRLPTELVRAAAPHVPVTARHFFGDHSALARCSNVLCYDASGCLTHLLLIGEDGDISVEPLPEEMTGKAAELPSVRLVFRSRADRERFISQLSPRLLRKLAEKPRRVGVSVA